MLRKLNRLEKLRLKQSREDLHKVKGQVDSQHLQLQNLLYEVLHLQKEVTKCLQFKLVYHFHILIFLFLLLFIISLYYPVDFLGSKYDF